VGAPGNRLDRDLNYQVKEDLDNIVKTSRHTNVGFVGLLEQRDWPHMNMWVMSVNMRLEHTLWTPNRLHIQLIDVSLDRYDYIRHGLHLNHRGKRKLVQLIADRIRCKPDTGKIPVIIGARSRPLFGKCPNTELNT
jgi:hypothetical protein